MTATGCAATSTPPSTSVADAPVAGDIPDNQKYVTVTGAAGDFSLQVPEGWAASAVPGGTAYSDKLNSIAVAETAVAAAPTTSSVTADVVPAVTSSFTNAGAAQVSTVTRSAGDAILITFEADSAKDAVTGATHRDAVEVYLFWRSGTQVALTLEGPTTADNVDPWRTVTDSFRWM